MRRRPRDIPVEDTRHHWSHELRAWVYIVAICVVLAPIGFFGAIAMQASDTPARPLIVTAPKQTSPSAALEEGAGDGGAREVCTVVAGATANARTLDRLWSRYTEVREIDGALAGEIFSWHEKPRDGAFHLKAIQDECDEAGYLR